ncbi:hypothetical protein WBJ53_17215 [Spirosoma sp. SC4-14]|uniref:hypothetical protein n=1 Tax=Spirosoma sp. SC4-14 TaxID=3128900 RepID=UPI0030CCFF5A
MAQFIEFTTSDNQKVLVHVDAIRSVIPIGGGNQAYIFTSGVKEGGYQVNHPYTSIKNALAEITQMGIYEFAPPANKNN